MRLIDANELLEVIAKQERWNVPDFVYESIKNAPTIEVALVVGERIIVGERMEGEETKEPTKEPKNQQKNQR